ncbi:MAG TPA: hypothetical protein VGP68_21165 [Gemmataceae bacterium]|jgi:hypothetical protein|nr:hypothetical protein [Gemmataceae bacterium]
MPICKSDGGSASGTRAIQRVELPRPCIQSVGIVEERIADGLPDAVFEYLAFSRRHPFEESFGTNVGGFVQKANMVHAANYQEGFSRGNIAAASQPSSKSRAEADPEVNQETAAGIPCSPFANCDQSCFLILLGHDHG